MHLLDAVELQIRQNGVEKVAETGAVADVIGVGTEFLAEAGDVDIYGAIRNDGSCPNAIHELLAGAQLTMSRHQLTQQTILGTRKTDKRTIDSNRFVVHIYLQALESKITLTKARLYHVDDIAEKEHQLEMKYFPKVVEDILITL